MFLLFTGPSAPGGFSLVQVSGSPNTLLASWTEPVPANGVILGYTISCNVIGDMGPVEAVAPFSFSGTLQEGMLTGLLPFTQYTCVISANTSAGEGAASGPLTATTDEAGKECSVKCMCYLIRIYVMFNYCTDSTLHGSQCHGNCYLPYLCGSDLDSSCHA